MQNDETKNQDYRSALTFHNRIFLSRKTMPLITVFPSYQKELRIVHCHKWVVEQNTDITRIERNT